MTSKNQTNPHIYGIGRKKESTAIVYLVPFTESTSQITCEVNGPVSYTHLTLPTILLV